MISHTTARFRRAFSKLPKQIRQQAKKAYKVFQQDPSHPGLQFKQIHPIQPVYSVRVGLHYRAVGIRMTMTWCGFGLESTRNTRSLFLICN
jgi:hypothetical protein